MSNVSWPQTAWIAYSINVYARCQLKRAYWFDYQTNMRKFVHCAQKNRGSLGFYIGFVYFSKNARPVAPGPECTEIVAGIFQSPPSFRSGYACITRSLNFSHTSFASENP